MGRHVPANKEAEKGSREWVHTQESPEGFWEIGGQVQDAGAHQSRVAWARDVRG